jgi:hypothetical protein
LFIKHTLEQLFIRKTCLTYKRLHDWAPITLLSPDYMIEPWLPAWALITWLSPDYMIEPWSWLSPDYILEPWLHNWAVITWLSPDNMSKPWLNDWALITWLSPYYMIEPLLHDWALITWLGLNHVIRAQSCNKLCYVILTRLVLVVSSNCNQEGYLKSCGGGFQPVWQSALYLYWVQ